MGLVSTMTNIALLHYTAPPVVGGVERVLEQQARLFAAAGHRVRVVAGRGEAQPGVRFMREPLLDSRQARILAAKADLDAGRLSRRLKAALRGVDVLIAHNAASLHKNLALTAALHQIWQQRTFPRLVLWHHDLAWGSQRYQAELHPGHPWDLLRTPWPGATQVTISTTRRTELSHLMGITGEEIRVVPNGIDIATFLKLSTSTVELAEKLGLGAASPLLLLPARLTRRKNIELALQALAALRTRLPAAALLVTGPLGPHNPANQAYFDSLLQLRAQLGVENSAYFLAEHVTGFVSDEVVNDLYRLADALLLPSRDEGFGIPVLEAGLAGKPAFCAEIPALRELGGEDAYYFSPDAPAAEVAELIARTLQASPTWRLAGRVRSQYTWEQIYARHLAPLVTA
jgi:glycosyltransferase involved in cell wall biosynthesis